jgi:uncharacterized OsmC-like protein
MSPTLRNDLPSRRENWAEVESGGRARSIVTLRSGHVLVADEPPGFAGGAGGENCGPTPTGFLVAALASDICSMLHRIAGELGTEIAALRARVRIAWNPRAIAGLDDADPVPFEAVSDIWLTIAADAGLVERMQAAYVRRCPLHNLLRKSGCRMEDRWHIERPGN